MMMSADTTFRTLTQELLKAFFELNPHWASHFGLHDPYDYQLPKGNTAHVLENHRLLETYVNRMSDTIEYQALSDAHKIDWHVLTRALERSHFEITEQRQHELNPLEGSNALPELYPLPGVFDSQIECSLRNAHSLCRDTRP